MSLTKATYSMISQAPINVRDFGATGDGVTDDSAAIQLAIDFATTVNKPTVGFGSTIVYFPSGVYLCKSTLVFAPFLNYVGVVSTIANSTLPYSNLNASTGTLIRAHEDIYKAGDPAGSNGNDGVLVQIPTGDAYVEGITFVGTAAINGNPNIGMRLGAQGGGKTCQGISLSNIRFVVCKVGMDLNSSLIESGVRVYFESCTTAITSQALQSFSGNAIGNEAYFINSYLGAYQIGLTHQNNCLDKFHFSNCTFSPNDNTSIAVTGPFTAITNISDHFSNCAFLRAFDGSSGAASLSIGSFTTAVNPTKITAVGCTFSSPVSFNNPVAGSQNFKYVSFSGCIFNCNTVGISAVNGIKFNGNDFIETVLTFTDSANRGVVMGNHFEMSTNTVPLVINNACKLMKVIGNSVSDAVTTSFPTFSGTTSLGCTVLGNDQNSGANTDEQRLAVTIASSVPANFSATRVLDLKDVNGVSYYVAASSTVW